MILQIHSFIYCALLKSVYAAPQEGCTRESHLRKFCLFLFLKQLLWCDQVNGHLLLDRQNQTTTTTTVCFAAAAEDRLNRRALCTTTTTVVIIIISVIIC